MKSRANRVLCLILALLLLPWGIFQTAIPVKAAYENTYVNTGDQRADILGVAKTQLGYRESGGYTKYGDWYGAPTMDWCGAFISWCANQAAIPTSVLRRTGFASPTYFGLTDVFYYSSGRTPQPGDLFFRIDSDGSYAHAGLVYYVEGSYFYTLEGNTWGDGDSTPRVMLRQRGLAGSYCFASPKYRNSSGHTHSYETFHESSHPHKEYKYCAGCNDKYYTGNTKVMSDCKTCKQENCTHQYGNFKKSDDTYHKGTCSLCEKVSSFQHEWVDGQVLREPDCKETGLKEQSCKQCDASREVTLPVTEDHKYSDWQYIDGQAHKMICEVCEEEEEDSHKQSTQWYSDGSNHWHICEDCGGRLKTASHIFSGDCESACITCGYVSPVGHVYAAAWEQDSKEHWHGCRNCSAEKDREEHKFSSDCDTTCDTCGYTRETSHVYGEEWKSNETGHWQVCKVCFQSSEVQTHVSDGVASEESAVFCTECSYEIAPALIHVHAFVIDSHDASGHYGACVCGEKLETTAHVWNPNTGKCADCEEPVPAVGKQSAVLQMVVQKVGVSEYLWLILVLPIVAVLAILLLIVLLILAIRKRSRNVEFDDDDDDEDDSDTEDGDGSNGESFAETELKNEQEESDMEPMPV